MIKIKRIKDVQAINCFMKEAYMYAQHLSTTALFEQCEPEVLNIWAGLMDMSHAIFSCSYDELPDKMESLFLDLSQIDYNKTIHEDRLCIRNIIMMLYRLNNFFIDIPQE